MDANSALVRTDQAFDAIPANTIIPNGAELDGVIYNSSVGLSIVTASFLSLSPPNTLGRTTLDFFDPSDLLMLTFTTPSLSFGISFNTFATDAGAFTVTTNLGDVASSFFDPFPGQTTGQFAGFTSDTLFTSVTITGGRRAEVTHSTT